MITYDTGTNIITVTQFTEASPCTFLDIYDADVAGGWGKITRQCSNQYCIKCYIQIGDSSTTTWFCDKNQQIIYESAFWTAGATLWTIKTNANLRFGEVLDVTDKTGYNGCSILILESSTWARFIAKESSITNVEILGSYAFSNVMVYFNGIDKMYTCLFIKNILPTATLVVAPDYSKTTVLNAIMVAYIYSSYHTVITLSNLRGEHLTHGIGFSDLPEVTVKDCYIRNSTYTFYIYSIQYDQKIINLDTDAWTISWAGTDYGKKLYRQYEFDLKVIDKDNAAINGATLKIWDKDSNLIVDTTTDATGVIATQTISRGYYNKANGDTLQDYSPHLIKIEKAGYTTYEADFTLEEKTDWTIALQTAGGGLMRNPPMTGGMV